MRISPTAFPGRCRGHRFFRYRRVGCALRTVPSLDPDKMSDDLVDRCKRCEPALGDDPMRRPVGLFELGVGFGMSCDPLAQCRDFLAGCAAEPEKRSEQQRIRVKEYPEHAGGGPLEQL